MEVNFLIMGTQKGGTTALANFLSQHSDVCLAPIKEVHFFDYDRNYYSGGNYYHSFFPNYTNQIAVGEATPIYMYLPKVTPRIANYNPQMKLIVLLRHPIDRAYSHYQMEVRRGWEFLPFSQAIFVEPLRLLVPQNLEDERCFRRVCSYCDRGYYSRQLNLIYRYFSREQVLVLLQEDLEQNHEQTLKLIYNFIGVNHPVNFPLPQRILAGNYDPLPDRGRFHLMKRFRPEIYRLEKLIDRDLSSWLIDKGKPKFIRNNSESNCS